MTNKYNTVLYTGVSNNLLRRIWDHKNKLSEDSFTKKYDLNKLVYYEFFDKMPQAIQREKQIKGGSRQKKSILITKQNPEWTDLYNSLI